MPSKWNDGEYYGKKSRNSYRRLDKLLNKEFDTCKDKAVDDSTLDRISKIIGKQTSLIHAVTKLTDTLMNNQRYTDIETLIHAIPAEHFREAFSNLPESEKQKWR